MSRPYFFSFFLPNASSTPPPQSAPFFFFFVFFFLSSWGREKTRQGGERRGEERWGFRVWGQKTNESCVFFPSKVQRQTARNATHGYSLYLKVHQLHCSHLMLSQKKHTHDLCLLFPHFSLPPSHRELSVVPSIRFPSFSCLTEWITAWGRQNASFRSIRLTVPRTLSICSLILSLFQFDQMWMLSLICDATKIFFVCVCLYWLSEPHRDRDMSMKRYTERRNTHAKNSPRYGVRTFCPFAIVVGRIMMMRPNT